MPAPETGKSAERVIRVGALQVPVDVHVGGRGAAELADALSAAWAWCPGDGLPGTPVRLAVTLDPDLDVVARAREAGHLAGPDLRRLMEWLSGTITTSAITARAGELVMLHGCAVADPESGAAAVLVGPSGAGKTTAACALGSHFGYLTDETAAIDADLRLLAYPKPLSLLHDHLPGKAQVAPGELGLRPPVAGARLASLLLLDRAVDGPRQPELTDVPTVHALALLGEQSSYLAQVPRPLQRLAALAHATGGVRRVRYREAADLVPVVTAALAGGAQ